MKKKNLTALLLAFVLMLSLAACGGDSGSASSDPASSGSAGSASSNPSGPAKDSIVIVTAAEPSHFDNIGEATSQNDVIVLNNIYDGLITIDANGEYHPALAERWEMAEDGLSYTFYLRQGVTFHNGYAFTADDVKFTLEGTNERNAGSSLYANFTTADIIDEYTVRLNLSAPYAAFLTGLASRDGFIQSKQYYEEVGHDGYQENPVGTGAYKFVSRQSGASITLAANEDFWGGAPEIKNVTIRIISEASTQMITLEAHEADIVLQPALASVLNLTGSDITWAYVPSAARTTLNFCCLEGSITRDVNLRRAVQCAINKDDVLLGAMEGYGSVIDIDMSDSYTGRPVDYAAPPAYDVEAAKAYLAQSDYKGEDFNIIVTAGTTAELAANIIQNQLIEVGINAKVGAYDSSTFTSMWMAGEYNAVIRSNQSSVMDAEALYSFFRHDAVAANDYDRIDEIEPLLLQGRATPNGAERLALYTKVVDIITEEAYQVPLYSDINIIAYDSSLSGVVAHPLNFYFIREWSWN